MTTTLNDDCLRMILFQLKDDFRTLSRIMQVSRNFLARAAPVLYGRLGHAACEKTIEGWSLNKRHKLSALLLTSSKFLKSGPSATVNNEGDMGHQNFFGLPLPSYSTPLFMDYFGLLKRLPKCLAGVDIWERLVEVYYTDESDPGDSKCYQHTRQTTARHATVLTKIYITDMEQGENWLCEVEKLEKLEQLLLNIWGPCSQEMRQLLNEFVTRHKIAFPGQLKLVHSKMGHTADLVLELNILLEKPEKLKLWLYDQVLSRVQRDISTVGNNINSNSNSSVQGSIAVFRSIKHLEFVEICDVLTPSAYALLPNILQQCRRLECIEMYGDYTSTLELGLENVFAWAPRDLYEAEKTAAAPTTLMPLKAFSGGDLPASVLLNAMHGFRYSLERIDFRSIHYNKVVYLDWTWSMPCLTLMKLGHCFLAFLKLEVFCPCLEELYLDNVQSLERNMNSNKDDFDHDAVVIKETWRAMPTLRTLQFSSTSDSTMLELDSIEDLTKLEELHLGREPRLDVFGRNMFDRLDTMHLLQWDLAHLRRLTFTCSYNPDWHALILQSTPNLEYFSGLVEMVFPSISDSATSFWTETKWDTLKHVAEFEVRANRWFQLGQEHMLHRQKEGLEEERLTGKYQTLDGRDIWNAHVTKIRSLELSGQWNRQGIEKLKLMLQTGMASTAGTNTNWPDVAIGNNTDNNHDGHHTSKGLVSKIKKMLTLTTSTNLTSTTDGDRSPLYGQVCFPRLRHVRFNSSLTDIAATVGDLDEVVKMAMQRSGMVRVDVLPSVLSSYFVRSLQEVDEASVPAQWDNDVHGDGNHTAGHDGYCVLTIPRANNSQKRYYYRLDI